MNIQWSVEPEDVAKVKSFVECYRNDPFVQQRIKKNLSGPRTEVSKSEFWQAMPSCQLTTQQKSGPDSAVTRFISAQPFPLRYEWCQQQVNLASAAEAILSDFGGLRRTNRIAEELAINLKALEQGGWNTVFKSINHLRKSPSVEVERQVADFIDDNFKGFGPKQSRNLLQLLGLTRFEIPIDSRVTKWLNDNGIVFTVSAESLANRDFYHILSDGIQRLCAECGVLPCVLDAAIFTSFDKGGWNDDNVMW